MPVEFILRGACRDFSKDTHTTSGIGNRYLGSLFVKANAMDVMQRIVV